MFPSNTAFILSLPWQLPISPKESAGSVFPWRWHGDIARQLWTACRDSGPFPFPPLTLLFPLSSSLPILLLPLCSSFGSNPTPWSVCVCVSANMNNYAQHMGNSAVCFPVFVSICQSVRAACYLAVHYLLNIPEPLEMFNKLLVGASMSLCYISVLRVVYDLIRKVWIWKRHTLFLLEKRFCNHIKFNNTLTHLQRGRKEKITKNIFLFPDLNKPLQLEN